MEILHVSAECYPMAKSGGLGDVVGALPKYQTNAKHYAKVVMPMYRTKYLYQNTWQVDAKGTVTMGDLFFNYTIIKDPTVKLGFDLYLVDIPGLLDREQIYGYDDDTERFTAFQIAVLDWVNQWQHLPDVVHCHDHHTGLVPFMMKHSYAFQKLAKVPSVFTIHNAQYQGWMGWNKSNYVPAWDSWKGGLLEWAGTINPLAAGIKAAWKVTTVSWSYLDELRTAANGLEALFEYERGKCVGILNGIDTEVWNPSVDTFITQQFTLATVKKGKKANKDKLCEQFGLPKNLPLFVFIGRLVGEKAADILPDALGRALHYYKNQLSVLVLGSGDKQVEFELQQVAAANPGVMNCYIGYNEALSHQIYAGADFLLMPSRVEPCGLNQLYAMAYGTVPVVRNTGGLRDTVKDMGDDNGWGIRFNNASADDVLHSIFRGIDLYANHPKQLEKMRSTMMQINHSWENCVNEYLTMYENL